LAAFVQNVVFSIFVYGPTGFNYTRPLWTGPKYHK